jgi:hypothetical protein
MEIQKGNYICDGITEEGELIEIQTGSFGALRAKIKNILPLGSIRIIHPIILQKHIELYDDAGKFLYRRKSPRRGTLWDLFKVLLYAPELPLTPGLVIELALVDVEERRIRDGRGSWRRKGVSIADKSLCAYHQSVPLTGPGDYFRFVPFGENQDFTVNDLGDRAQITKVLAGKTLYVLTKLEIVKRIGKKGNAWVYRLNKGKKGVPEKTGRGLKISGI